MMTGTEKPSMSMQRTRQRQKPPMAAPTMPEVTVQEQAASVAIPPVRRVRKLRRPPTPEIPAPVSTLPEPNVSEPVLPQDSFQVTLSNCALATDERPLIVERAPIFKGFPGFMQFPKFQRPPTVWISSLLRLTANRQKKNDSNALTVAWTWLRAKYTISTTKRLRVSETISLGEKRFVAIVAVEGREFLIGGGTAGMSLLAQLGAGAATADGTDHEFGRGGGPL